MDDLIQQALDAVGIPPGMRDRAIKNLKQKSKEEIQQIIDNANARKEKAKDCIRRHDENRQNQQPRPNSGNQG